MRKMFLLILQIIIFNIYSFSKQKHIITNSNFLPVILFDSINNLSDKKIYISLDIYGDIFLHSIKNYLKNYKNVDIKYSIKNKENVDLIIKINYQLYTEKETMAKLTLFIVDNKNQNIVFEKIFYSYTDRKLFDTVDLVINEIKKFCEIIEIYSIEEKEKEYGAIYFKRFDVGKENYFLYVNDVPVSKYVNMEFSKIIKLEANQNYTIKLIKDNNEKNIFQTNIYVKKDKTNEITYRGYATLVVNKLKFPDLLTDYYYYLDQEKILPEKLIENLEIRKHYNFSIKDNNNKIVYNEIFYLEDGENKNLNPKLNWNNSFFLSFGSMVTEYWFTGIGYNFLKYFWCAGNIGINSFYFNGKNNIVSFFTLDGGVYFFTLKVKKN